MKILITICARGGSKGIPGKNIKIIDGKPLIAITANHALEFKNEYGDTDIYLSTDDILIRDKVKEVAPFVNTTYLRPEELATDTSGKIEVINDVLEYAESKENKKYDLILDLDVSSPLRNLNDLKGALEIIKNQPNAINLFSVNEANRNPYFNMVEMGESGFYQLCKKGEFLSRQTTPKVYDLNASFYFYRRDFFTKKYKTPITENSLIYEMPHICFDLDHPIDFDFLSFLIAENKLPFKL